MKPELKARIVAFNKAAEERKAKASDLDVIMEAFAKLPPGQLKKVLSDDVMSVPRKHGVEI